MRVIIVGYGNQGNKRLATAAKDVVAIVDKVSPKADFQSVFEVPLDSFDAAIVSTGDTVKLKILKYLLENKKNILVEKPLISNQTDQLAELLEICERNKTVCYTAYNHRFEPHFKTMANILKSKKLGKLYSIRMFYGNGTARLVKNSLWRDQGAGVLTDLGSHLIDTLDFWLGNINELEFTLAGAFNHENVAFDHVIVSSNCSPVLHLEMSMVSWRNSFECNVYGELGSAHIDSLCKWGPSSLITRERILPSGKPSEEKSILNQEDPTWEEEYKHFKKLCAEPATNTLRKDIAINSILLDLASNAGIDQIVSNK